MELADMSRSHTGSLFLVLASVIAASCYVSRIPDLTLPEAAEIISRGPEFNRYARLVAVESLHHEKDSMDSVTFGKFTFRYLNSQDNAPLIEARVDFRYHEGKWYLNGFYYGCPTDCRDVNVYDGPDKKH